MGGIDSRHRPAWQLNPQVYDAETSAPLANYCKLCRIEFRILLCANYKRLRIVHNTMRAPRLIFSKSSCNWVWGGGDRGGVGDEIWWKGREEAGQKIKSSQYLCNTTGSSETKLGNKATGCVISLPRPVLRKGKLWDSLRKRS